MTPVRILFSTIDSFEVAEKIANQLVEERLAACVNIIPKLTSVYKWKGEVEHASEHLLIIKTVERRLNLLMKRLKELHPYEIPEIIAFPIEQGYLPYLEWVVSETSDE
ncbi:MAG: divalent-cation tolerance protein CutA [Acidobacteriota bacterium]